MLRNRTAWLRANALVLTLGLLLGAAAGILGYLLFRLNGVAAAAVAGAAMGIAAVAVIRLLATSVTIDEIELSIPQLSKVTFAVTKDRRGLAYRIVNQMASRVAVQRLDDDAGYAREALTSLYDLFTWLRGALDEEPGSRPPGKPNVDVLAMNLLNCHLRPFLGRWHRRLGDWERKHSGEPESQWPDDAEFRAELSQLQQSLRKITVAFAELAGYADYRRIIGLGPDTAPPPRWMIDLAWRPVLTLTS